MRTLNFDFIVVGSGLAGLLAAFHAADYGSVALISKSELDISNSYHAQGGIAAAVGEDDHPDFHFEDSMIAGRNLCDQDAVSILVNEGLDRVNELINNGMEFDKDAYGKILLGLEGGHSKRRILHADGDATGKMTTSFMLKKVLAKPGITAFEYCAAVKIIVEDNICKGVQTLKYTNCENIIFLGKATILATGGLSRLYSRSTNPYTATGDGIALAWQAGARLADMEFIQFHPTALSLPGEEAYLISEAVRGEGAHLLDVNGVRFMKGVHPLAELAPRDVVATAIFKRMQETDSNVFLSLKHLSDIELSERFHSIIAHLKSLGINLLSDLIPIAPAAHYMVGGIRTDIWGQTSITGLFACGEVAATGVMGANRLASNSLLECLVYGKRVIEKARKMGNHTALTIELKEILLCQETDQEFLKMKNELASIMSNQVGIVRNEEGLKKALDVINSISNNCKDKCSDYNFHKMVNLTDICRLITLSAIERKESRGGHVRSDYPFELDEQLHHIIQQKGEPLKYEPVRI
ncbi:MAG: L-aspartate oxidase [Mariniphaga sp.]